MWRDLYLTDLPFPLASSRSFAPKASGIALDQTSQFASDGFLRPTGGDGVEVRGCQGDKVLQVADVGAAAAGRRRPRAVPGGIIAA